MSRRCPECGTELADTARFCGRCGAEQTQRCKECGADAPPDAAFCRNCGVAFGPETSPPQPSPAVEQPSPAGPSSIPPRARRPLRRVAAGVAVALLLAGGAIAAVVVLTGGGGRDKAIRTETQPTTAPTSQQRTTAPTSPQPTTVSTSETPAPTLADELAPRLQALAADQLSLDIRVRLLRAGETSFARLRRSAGSLADRITRTQGFLDTLAPAADRDAATLSLARRALAAHLAYARTISGFPPLPRSLTKAQARAALARAEQAERAYSRLAGADPGLPRVSVAVADHARLLTVVRPPKPTPPSGLTQFVDRIESFLNQSTSGRAAIVSALGAAMNCSTYPEQAANRVASVVQNRQGLLDQLAGVPAPTAQAARIVSLLRGSLSHSIAADRHYGDWLSSLSGTSNCPLPQTGDYNLARAEDAQASAAKREFIAAFNPLASKLHRRTWSESEI